MGTEDYVLEKLYKFVNGTSADKLMFIMEILFLIMIATVAGLCTALLYKIIVRCRKARRRRA